jgi:uncharacterized protein (DUF1499 family)
MSQQVTLEQVDRLARQLEPLSSLQLIARVAERLGQTLPVAAATDLAKAQMQKARLQLASELLAEVDDIEDDSQGKSEAVDIIRRLREERMAQLCQKDA